MLNLRNTAPVLDPTGQCLRTLFSTGRITPIPLKWTAKLPGSPLRGSVLLLNASRSDLREAGFWTARTKSGRARITSALPTRTKPLARRTLRVR